MAVSLMTGWAVLAVYWSDIQSPALRTSLAVGIALATVLAFALQPRKGRVLAGYLACFLLFTIWWSGIAPSNARDWQRDVAMPPHAEVNGDLVTMHDVRDFSYATETD